MDANGILKIGPSETKGEYGGNWDLCSNQITQILIWYGENIDGMQFQFVKDGRLVLSEFHGRRTGAENFISVRINHPSEYIIKWSMDDGSGPQGLKYSSVRNLLIVTNLQHMDLCINLGNALWDVPISDRKRSSIWWISWNCKFRLRDNVHWSVLAAAINSGSSSTKG